MELSGSNTKKFLIFLKTETLQTCYISRRNFLSSKNKKIHLEKIAYISEKRNPEKISYIFLKESLSFILKNGNPKKLFILQETELSCISGNGNFLYLGNLSIFKTTSLFRALTYVELKPYSEPWYIQNQRRIQNTVKHLRWNIYLAHFLIFPEMKLSWLIFHLYFRWLLSKFKM